MKIGSLVTIILFLVTNTYIFCSQIDVIYFNHPFENCSCKSVIYKVDDDLTAGNIKEIIAKAEKCKTEDLKFYTAELYNFYNGKTDIVDNIRIHNIQFYDKDKILRKLDLSSLWIINIKQQCPQKNK